MEDIYKVFGYAVLAQTGQILRGPGQNKVRVKGQLQVTLRLNNRHAEQEVYVN